MKKLITLLSIFLAFQIMGIAQNSSEPDNLRHELSIAKNDSSRAHFMNRLSDYYRANRPDSAIFYANKALILARHINAPELELSAMGLITLAQIYIGNDSKALQINLEAIKNAELHGIIGKRPELYLQSGRIYEMSGNYSKAMEESRKAKIIADTTNAIFFMVLAPARIAEMFLYMNQLDSALYYGHMSEDYAQKNSAASYFSQHALGQIYFKKGNSELALKYLHEASQSSRINFLTFRSLYQMAKVYQEMGKADSSAYYAIKSLNTSMEGQLYKYIIEANILLSEIYEKSDPSKALQYSKSALAYRDTLDNFTKNATLEAFFNFDEQERQYELERATRRFRSQLRNRVLLGSSLTLMIIALLLYRNNRRKLKDRERIEKAYVELKSTQSQLIQSEKMASLGELTAGIAHEIQNPLNFVNNFSEVSKELMAEMNEELEKGDINEAKEVGKDISQNLDKINHHGQRASSIVKGMLEHSRTGDGVKEPTDLNALADEYLRLAYHGLRAKDKSFNADFKTEFDEKLPKVNVIPQDIGRVFLNLINNALYAVDKKAKEGAEGYRPEVVISTKKQLKSIEISVKDNGQGIPNEIKDKIFQPFFTTKPTGQGTGLGLSLSYDIITQGHDGQLEVETEEEGGTRFIIQLPVV